jgi:hypothetical protein
VRAVATREVHFLAWTGILSEGVTVSVHGYFLTKQGLAPPTSPHLRPPPRAQDGSNHNAELHRYRGRRGYVIEASRTRMPDA